MKFFIKKAVAGIVAVCLIVAMAIPAGTAEAASAKKYTDISGHTYEKALVYAVENGLLSSTSSKISPDAKLTKGDAAASLNALLGATTPFAEMDKVGNLKKSSRYYDAVSIGLNCGYLVQKPNGDVYSPAGAATYKYLNDIFSSVLGFDMKNVIIGGNKADSTLTRGEFAAVLQEIAPNIVTKNVKDAEFFGDVYVTKANLNLSDVFIEGNLIITDAVGDQNVSLRNVDIAGKLIVRGGGEHSINIIGASRINDVVVKQVNNNVSVKVLGNAEVRGTLTVNNGSSGVNIQGKVAKVAVAANDVKVSLDNATVENVEVSGKGSSLVVSEKTTVNAISVVEAAEGTKLDIAGTIQNVEVSGKDASVAVSEKATIKAIAVAEAAVGANLNVAGVIENVVIAAKGSALNVSGQGKITEVKAEKTAENFTVAVDKEAVIATVDSAAADTAVTGEGKVDNSVGTTVNTTTPSDTTNTGSTGSTGGTGGGGGGGSTTAESSINISKIEVVDAKTLKVTLSPNVSGASFTVDSKSVTSTFANGVYTVTLNSELVYGANYSLRVSRTNYSSTTKTFSGSDAPQYAALDALLKSGTGSGDYTYDVSGTTITLKVPSTSASIATVAGTGIVGIVTNLISNTDMKATSVTIGSTPISPVTVDELWKNASSITKNITSVSDLSGMKVEISFKVKSSENVYKKAYTLNVVKK